MKKKFYSQPKTYVVGIENCSTLLAGSGKVGDKNINIGGSNNSLDGSGNSLPETDDIYSKHNKNFWDSED